MKMTEPYFINRNKKDQSYTFPALSKQEQDLLTAWLLLDMPISFTLQLIQKEKDLFEMELHIDTNKVEEK